MAKTLNNLGLKVLTVRADAFLKEMENAGDETNYQIKSLLTEGQESLINY